MATTQAEATVSSGAGSTDLPQNVVRKSCLLKLGGKTFNKKLQWRLCVLTLDGQFHYYDLKGGDPSKLEIKGTVKLHNSECRLEAAGGDQYETLRKLKPPKPPQGTTPWQNSGFFYIKPKPATPGAKTKTYYFMCDIRERDKWIFSIREVSASISSPALRSTISTSGITLDGFGQPAPHLRANSAGERLVSTGEGIELPATAVRSASEPMSNVHMVISQNRISDPSNQHSHLTPQAQTQATFQQFQPQPQYTQTTPVQSTDPFAPQPQMQYTPQPAPTQPGDPNDPFSSPFDDVFIGVPSAAAPQTGDFAPMAQPASQAPPSDLAPPVVAGADAQAQAAAQAPVFNLNAVNVSSLPEPIAERVAEMGSWPEPTLYEFFSQRGISANSAEALSRLEASGLPSFEPDMLTLFGVSTEDALKAVKIIKLWLAGSIM